MEKYEKDLVDALKKTNKVLQSLLESGHLQIKMVLDDNRDYLQRICELEKKNAELKKLNTSTMEDKTYLQYMANNQRRYIEVLESENAELKKENKALKATQKITETAIESAESAVRFKEGEIEELKMEMERTASTPKVTASIEVNLYGKKYTATGIDIEYQKEDGSCAPVNDMIVLRKQ